MRPRSCSECKSTSSGVCQERAASTMANRDDVLDDFIVEEEMSPVVLRTYLRRYPEYIKDLLALFNEITMSDLEAIERKRR